MKISIVTPGQLIETKESLIQQALDLMERQERSCLRYRRELLTIRNKIIELNRLLSGSV